jgi:hypothetical protein
MVRQRQLIDGQRLLADGIERDQPRVVRDQIGDDRIGRGTKAMRSRS